MFSLFQSIFGRDTRPGTWPESLVEAATERAVEGTDPRLRLLSGYRRRLREPLILAIDHVVALVDALPPPLVATRAAFGDDPRLAALFVSAAQMFETLT